MIRRSPIQPRPHPCFVSSPHRSPLRRLSNLGARSSVSSSSTSFSGNPNTTAVPSLTPSWSNLTLAIPSSSSSSHAVTLISSSNATSDTTTTGFTFYGRFVFIQESGAFESLFYAVPTENGDIWNLNWNATGDGTEGQVLVSLRNAKPLNGVANITDAVE